MRKYAHDLTVLCDYLSGAVLTKTLLIGWPDLKVKALKIQKSMFCDENRELTRSEYIRLIRTVETEGNERLSLVIQTICATGIWVSKLRFITAEAVQSGRA